MSARYASGKWARGICDRCGFAYKLDQLRGEFVKDVQTGLLVCPTCWDPDHPQLDVGRYIVDDPQALRNPRSDSAELEASRELTGSYDPSS